MGFDHSSVDAINGDGTWLLMTTSEGSEPKFPRGDRVSVDPRPEAAGKRLRA